MEFWNLTIKSFLWQMVETQGIYSTAYWVTEYT